jgi:hypothetical protein
LPRMFLLGIEAGRLLPGSACSPEVRAAIAGVVERFEEFAERLLSVGGPAKLPGRYAPIRGVPPSGIRERVSRAAGATRKPGDALPHGRASETSGPASTSVVSRRP